MVLWQRCGALAAPCLAQPGPAGIHGLSQTARASAALAADHVRPQNMAPRGQNIAGAAAMLLDKLRVFYFVLHGVLALLIDAQSIAPDISGDLYQIYERNGLTALV